MKNPLKELRDLAIGIALFAFLIAFCMWFFRPIDGYFKPAFREDGSIEMVWFVRTTWWGLFRKEYPVEYRHDRAFYEIDGTTVLIDEWKFETFY
jgi:hypothetical protein